jgi:hypothetical protein
MARITFGMGTSHSQLLSTPHAEFASHAARDRRNPHVKDWDGLVRERAAWIDRELTHEVTLARHQASQAAIERLSEAFAEAAPDVLVIVGDDQGEWFSPDNIPVVCIYWGTSVENLPPSIEGYARPSAYWGYYGDGANRAFPVDAELGGYLVESLTLEHGFDMAQMRVQPRSGPFGHAWASSISGSYATASCRSYRCCSTAISRRTSQRRGDATRWARPFGEASKPGAPTGRSASSALSHFLVDEALDRAVLKALAARDVEALAAPA